MDDTETICFNDVRESFLNVLSTEELHLLTPRDIRNTINSWATGSTDKEKVQELILEWLEDEYPRKKDELSPEEKHKRLQLAISDARRYVDFVLDDHSFTDDGRKNFRVAEEKDDAIEKRFSQELHDWEEYYGVEYSSGADEYIDRLGGQRGKDVSDYLQKLPTKRETVNQGKHHGKCDIDEYKKNMYQLLDVATPIDRNSETRLIKTLDEIGYGHSDELNGYYYLFSFLSELIRYEFIICREVKPYKKDLENIIRRASYDELDSAMLKRLNYYKDIGVRNKHRHSATLISGKWAITFTDFAKLYRKILRLSNKALSTPLA